MTGIIVTFVVGVLGLLLLLVFCLRQGESSAAKVPTDNEGQLIVVGLSGAFLLPLDILVGTGDYHKLRGMPGLKPVCKMFWRDRRRIVLLWLAELQKDVRILWEFRRFLVRNGLVVTFREEAGVVAVALLALLCLKAARTVVFAFGPFTFYRALGYARFLVERLSISGVAPLARASASIRTDIEQRWKQHVLATGLRAG